MRIVVVYESVFGNTHRIAAAIEHGARRGASTRLVFVGERATKDIADADVVVLGGPTHAFSMSTPASRSQAVAWTLDPKRHLSLDAGEPVGGVREWLDAQVIFPPRFAAFDTRASTMRHLPGSAARAIDRRLRARGVDRVCAPMDFYVSPDNELLPGEEERARIWGEQLSTSSIPSASTP